MIRVCGVLRVIKEVEVKKARCGVLTPVLVQIQVFWGVNLYVMSTQISHTLFVF